MWSDFVSSVVEIIHERIVVVLVRQEVGGFNRTAIGVSTVEDQIGIIHKIQYIDSIVKRDKDSLHKDKSVCILSAFSQFISFMYHTCGVWDGSNPPGIFVEEHLQSGSEHGDVFRLQYWAAFSWPAGSTAAVAETIKANKMANLAMVSRKSMKTQRKLFIYLFYLLFIRCLVLISTETDLWWRTVFSLISVGSCDVVTAISTPYPWGLFIFCLKRT